MKSDPLLLQIIDIEEDINGTIAGNKLEYDVRS
jgi:hypothetical protein